MHRFDFYDMKSRFLFIKAFYFHLEVCVFKKGNNVEAMKHYKEAVTNSPNNFSAQYGYGQILIIEVSLLKKKNYIDALKCFEHIISNETSERVEELYKTLGYLYSKNMKREEAISFYQKSIRFDQNDFESLIEYAGIQEHHDPLSSLESYQRALEIVKKNEETEPELHNNIGVLLTKLGKESEAVNYFQNAISICKKRKDQEKKYSQIILTIMFNLAACYEELSMLGEAVVTYKSLLAENQFYVDALLRLAFLQFKRGSHLKALEYTDQAIARLEQTRNGKIDLPLCLKAFLLTENGEKDSARLVLESIKKKYGIDDSYARLAILSQDYLSSVKLRLQPSEQS